MLKFEILLKFEFAFESGKGLGHLFPPQPSPTHLAPSCYHGPPGHAIGPIPGGGAAVGAPTHCCAPALTATPATPHASLLTPQTPNKTNPASHVGVGFVFMQFIDSFLPHPHPNPHRTCHRAYQGRVAAAGPPTHCCTSAPAAAVQSAPVTPWYSGRDYWSSLMNWTTRDSGGRGGAYFGS